MPFFYDLTRREFYLIVSFNINICLGLTPTVISSQITQLI